MAVASVAGWPFSQIKGFLDYLLIECGLAANTIGAYRRDLVRFSGYCDGQGLSDPMLLTPVFLQGYVRQMQKEHLATASIARHLAAIKMFLRFHLLTGQVDKDIFSVMERPKTWCRLPVVLDQKRTVELITAADPQAPTYLRDRALLEVLYATGMRASEAADLPLEGINFQIGYLRCLGKGRKERIIPIHAVALNAVSAYVEELRPRLMKERSCPNVFVSRTGRALSRIEVWRIVRRAAVRAGLTGKVTPHTLRHCFGSHLLHGGADLRVVQELLGHADVTTTQIYTHVDQQRLRAMHKKYHPRG